MLPDDVWDNILQYSEFENNFLFLRTVNKQWYNAGSKIEKSHATSLSEIMKSVSRVQETINDQKGLKLLCRYGWPYLGEVFMDYCLLNEIARKFVKSVPWDPLSVCSAGTKDNFNFIIWLKTYNNENSHKLMWDPAISMSSAALEGNLSFMTSMYKIGHIPTIESSKMAALKGSIPVLSWLQSINCSMEDVTQYLAEEGNLEGLVWANSHGIPCDIWTLDAAAYGGHIDVVLYLIENVQEPTRDTLESAACGGNIRTFEYLASRYPELVDPRLYDLAVRYMDIDNF